MTLPELNLDALLGVVTSGATTTTTIAAAGVSAEDVILFPDATHAWYWITTDTAPSLVGITITADDTVQTATDTSAGTIAFTVIRRSQAIT